MRFRPANIRLINRRSNLLRLLLALYSGEGKNNDNYKNNPPLCRVDRVTPYQAESLMEEALGSCSWKGLPATRRCNSDESGLSNEFRNSL
jgi:hypothetical protein